MDPPYQTRIFIALRQTIALASVDIESQTVTVRNAEGAIACLMMAAMLLATSEFTSSPENIDEICAVAAKKLARLIADARAFLASGEPLFPTVYADDAGDATLH